MQVYGSIVGFVTRRRPDRLARLTAHSAAIAIDVGATKIAAGLVHGSGAVLHRHRDVETPAEGGEVLVDVLADLGVLLRGAHPEAVGIGLGIAGVVDHSSGTVGFAGNHAHRAVPLRAELTARTGLPVVVDNDANTAVWAEAVATGCEDVLLLALGTGLGSGLVSEGRLLRGGRGGRGIEVGHLPVEAAKGRSCPCGGTGCLELLVSGQVLFDGVERIVAREPSGILAELVGGRGRRVLASHVVDAVRKGDPSVVALVHEMARTLGRAVASSALPWFGVERVAIGGALADLAEVLAGPIEAACAEGLGGHRFLETPAIERAVHGRDSSLVGAGLMLLAQESDPDLRHPRPLVAVAERVDPVPAVEPGSRGTVLHVSPHPDDESLGAPCTLLALQEAGFHVINLACSLGRPHQEERRRAELEAAMDVAGFELVVPERRAAISSGDDHDRARRTISRWVSELIEARDVRLVVGPHVADGHHGHETVAMAIRDAVGCHGDGLAWWMWSIWADLLAPTLISPSSPAHLAVSHRMLDCYEGENERNDYRSMLEPLREVNAVRGIEQVFGFGSAAPAGVSPQAELLTEVRCVGDRRWERGVARVLDEPAVGTRWEPLDVTSPLLGAPRPFGRRVRTRLGLAWEAKRIAATVPSIVGVF